MTRHNCDMCADYAQKRGPRIREEIAKTKRGPRAQRAWTTFMKKFHEKHVAEGRS